MVIADTADRQNVADKGIVVLLVNASQSAGGGTRGATASVARSAMLALHACIEPAAQ